MVSSNHSTSAGKGVVSKQSYLKHANVTINASEKCGQLHNSKLPVTTYHRMLHVHIPYLVVPRPNNVGVLSTLSTNSPTKSSMKQVSETSWSEISGPMTRARFAVIGKRETQRDPRCGVILFDPFRLLILLVLNKMKHNNDPAKWSLPKGLQEKWETAEKCALRELFEETGFNLSIRYLRQHNRKVMVHQNTYFIVWVDSTKIRLCPKDTREIERAEFVPLQQLTTLACNCDLRRWRDQSFPKLLPTSQHDIVSIWGQSPLLYKVHYSCGTTPSSANDGVVVSPVVVVLDTSDDTYITPDV